MRANKILNSLILVNVLIVIIGLFTFAHICEAMGDMKPNCVTTKNVAIFICLILGGLTIVKLFVKNSSVGAVVSILRFICGGAILLLPSVIAPVCEMKSMHCYVYTRPLLVIVGIVIIGILLFELLSALREARGEKHGNFS